MATVGIRELRDHLSKWLDAVQSGEEITVTDRGKPVAKIVQVPSGRGTLEQLIAQGRARPALRPKTPLNPNRPKPIGGNVSDIVIEQRR